jgi:hypothetical protein
MIEMAWISVRDGHLGLVNEVEELGTGVNNIALAEIAERTIILKRSEQKEGPWESMDEL